MRITICYSKEEIREAQIIERFVKALLQDSDSMVSCACAELGAGGKAEDE